MGRPPIKTANGYQLDEVVSSFQKSIRRGLEEDALYWAKELTASNYEAYCFKRVAIISCEDVGLADSTIPAQIAGLLTIWEFLAKKKSPDSVLCLAQAVIILCRAKKSRLVCDAWFLAGQERKEIPDYARDQHTAAGRKLGRDWKSEEGVDFWLDEASHLENEATEDELPNPYRQLGDELFRQECLAGGTSKQIELLDEQF